MAGWGAEIGGFFTATADELLTYFPTTPAGCCWTAPNTGLPPHATTQWGRSPMSSPESRMTPHEPRIICICWLPARRPTTSAASTGMRLGLAEVPKPRQPCPCPRSLVLRRYDRLPCRPPAGGIVGDGHTALATDDVAAARARFSEMGYAVDDNVIPDGLPALLCPRSLGQSV